MVLHSNIRITMYGIHQHIDFDGFEFFWFANRLSFNDSEKSIQNHVPTSTYLPLWTRNKNDNNNEAVRSWCVEMTDVSKNNRLLFLNEQLQIFSWLNWHLRKAMANFSDCITINAIQIETERWLKIPRLNFCQNHKGIYNFIITIKVSCQI